MDSRELYSAAKHLGILLNWEQDWIHFGTGPEINNDLIDDLINDFLKGEFIHFIHERMNSGTFKQPELSQKIKELLGKSNFELWNESMDRAIQFNQIGVLLKGTKKTNTFE